MSVVEVTRTVTIAAAPGELLDLVMDIERYAEVDTKIAPVLWAKRDGDVTEFACRPKIGPLRNPKIVQRLTRTGDERIDIVMCPPPLNRFARTAAEFRASFVCTPAPGGATELVRTLRFDLKAPGGWVLGAVLRRYLPGEVDEELRRAQRHFAS